MSSLSRGSSRRCWAESLGHCEGKMSREHIFSDSILKEFPSISVGGFHWCREEPQVISRKSFVVKRLCRKHNSALSSADHAALTLFRNLKNSALPNREELNENVNGNDLEQWFIKTAINVLTTEPDPPQWETVHHSTQPPLGLVQKAFGIVPLRAPMGLYLLPSVRRAEDGLSVQCLHLEGGTIVSVITTVLGCRFFFSLDPNGWPMAEDRDSILFGPEIGADFHYRPPAIRVISSTGATRVVQLQWNE